MPGRVASKTRDLLIYKRRPETELQVSEQSPIVWKIIANGSWLSGQEFVVSGTRTVLGRGKDCDITIPGTHLSRNHAEIVVQGDKLLVRDMNSANGTYVNDEKIDEALVGPGDTIRMDVYSFRVEGVGAINGDDPTKTKPRVTVDTSAQKALDNIRSINTKKDYSETQWVTKPTSVGNRTHNVSHHKGDGNFWIALAIGLAVIGGLVFYFFI